MGNTLILQPSCLDIFDDTNTTLVLDITFQSFASIGMVDKVYQAVTADSPFISVQTIQHALVQFKNQIQNCNRFGHLNVRVNNLNVAQIPQVMRQATIHATCTLVNVPTTATFVPQEFTFAYRTNLFNATMMQDYPALNYTYKATIVLHPKYQNLQVQVDDEGEWSVVNVPMNTVHYDCQFMIEVYEKLGIANEKVSALLKCAESPTAIVFQPAPAKSSPQMKMSSAMCYFEIDGVRYNQVAFIGSCLIGKCAEQVEIRIEYATSRVTLRAPNVPYSTVHCYLIRMKNMTVAELEYNIISPRAGTCTMSVECQLVNDKLVFDKLTELQVCSTTSSIEFQNKQFFLPFPLRIVSNVVNKSFSVHWPEQNQDLCKFGIHSSDNQLIQGLHDYQVVNWTKSLQETMQAFRLKCNSEQFAQATVHSVQMSPQFIWKLHGTIANAVPFVVHVDYCTMKATCDNACFDIQIVPHLLDLFKTLLWQHQQLFTDVAFLWH